jgi:hypothetical protein
MILAVESGDIFIGGQSVKSQSLKTRSATS